MATQISDMVGMKFDPKGVQNFMGQHGHGKLIGLTYHDSGDNWIELGLPYNEKLIGDPSTGILASGAIITLMDNATSMSVWIKRGEFQPQATMDLRVDYLRPATPHKTVYGRGECYRITSSIALVRGYAYEDDPDDPIAQVAGTFIKTNPFK